jgi:alpha-L-fucosidase
MTMNHSWGYVPEDTHYKSARELIHTLCETAGRGGNFLLNVSPMGSGALPPEQVERLEHVAQWMARHAEAIHDTEPGLEPWQWYGPSTRRGNRLYLHVLARPYESVTLRGVKVRRVEKVSVLGRGTALDFRIRTGIIESVFPDPDGEVRIKVPDDELDGDATVIVVDFAETPLSPPLSP